MLSVRAIKSNKRLFSLAISLIVIITMLMSPANFASAQGEVTTTPDVVPTEADTLTPEPTTEPVQTEEPTAEPTQTEESPTPEPTSMEEPTAEPTPESTIASDETSGDLPNIQLAAPEGWEAPLVLSLQPGSHVNDMLTNGEQEYLDLAVFNNGPEIITPFTVCLDIDGEQVQCWDVNGLAAGAYFLVEDWQYTADHGDGSHYFELIADVNNTVMEADETDNTWAFDFYWQPSELDTLSVGSPLINDAFEKMIPPGMSLQNTDGSNLPGYIDTSAYMIGSVAVGVILPESAGSSENWTTDEKNNVTSEIQQGVNRWTAWSTSSGDFVNKDRVAANVSFVYEFNYSIPTTVEPITLSTEYECTWISQVLANMGFTNPNGCAYRVYDYLDDLRTRQGTDWATVIFVVDSSADYDGTFSDGYFAYAYLNGPLIVMTYDNDGWNIGRMDQVVQHEMGHIFGAGDNYYQANYGGCTSTTKQYGYLGIPNKNCMYNNPSAITNVLMNDNTIDRNHWTGQYQVGWRDSDGDTIADVVDTLPKFTMTGLDESLNLTGVLNDEPYPASTWYGVDVTINTIASARYRVDTGDWLPLSAADGTFDTDSEGISFSLDGIGNGKHSLEIEGSNTRGNTYIATVSLEAPNDRMANATAMKLNTVYSSITRWGAVTADEPVNVCNSGDTSSVWYKFTAPSKGVYRLNAYGSNYSPNLTVVKKGTGTATTPVVCGETNTEYEYSSQLSFNAAASATYLIGVSGGTDSTNLSLKIEKLTCPSGAICGAVVGGDGSVLHSPALEIYNTAGTYVGNGQGEYSGFIAGTVVGTKSASYKIITAKEGSLIVNKGVVVPGYYTPSAVGLPKTLVNVLDTTGAEIAVDSIAVVSQADNEIGAFLDGTEVGQPLTLYAAAGTYNLFAASDAAGLEVYQPGVAIVSSSNPGTVTLNASALPQDTFSFVLDEITSSAVWIYSPDGYGHEMAVNTNRTITFAAPVNTSIPYISYEYYKTDAANLLWNCYMFLSDPGNEVASIAGGDDHPYQFGGTLSVAPYLSDARFRLDEGHGEIYAGVMDGYGHKINQIYYYGYSTSGSSMQSANDRSQFIADLTTHETGDGEVLYRPLHDPDVLNAQSWVYENVVPTFTVTDALSNPVSTSSVPFLNSPSSFNIASTNPTGTWTVNESVDLGEFGGEKTGSTTFEVYSLADHPLANDDVGQAVIIPALLPSPFTATGVDTMGCTTATNDPLIAALKSKGYASVWYKYVADHDGILTLDTFGSKYDTVLNVWQGAPGSFVNRAYNDDFIDEMGTRYTSSRLNVDVRLGQTYYIEVTQYASASDENLAVQSLEAAPKPDGDVEIQQIGGELDLRASLNPCYSLTVTASPATSGKITRSPAANCLGTKYANGTKITLTAVPIAKYGFLNWSNSVSINPYDFKISGDTSLKGEFIYLAAPVLTSPASGQLTNNNMTTFTWKAVTYGSTYEIQIDNLATFANPIELTATPSELAYTASPALTDGLKYWRVRTISSRGEPGAWSAVRSFRVDTVPPSAPALLSPAVSATVRGTPAYTWSIPAGAKAYQFEYASDTEFASAIHTSAVLTSAKYIPPTQDLGTYYWHVKARDAAGNWSNWSAARSVTITTPIPVAPILVSPAAGAFVTTSTPTFTWNAAPYGYQYEIQIGKSYTFSLSSIVAGGKLDPGALTFTSPSLNDGTYYWRVKTWNNNTTPEAGKWSAYRIVKIDTTPPLAPNLLSPAASATVRGTPAYTWSIPAGAKAYQFEYASDTEFASGVHTSAVLTSAKYIPPTQDLGTYYWHVKARDAAGNWSNWSAARSVTITTPIPVAPILVSPAAGAFVTTSTPTFTWNAAPYGYQYEIQIGKSYTFSLSSIVAGGKLDPGALTFTSPSLNDGTYYWRVKAWNNNTTPEAGKWSAYRIVKIDTVNPADPVLKSPADNAVLLTTRPALSVTALPAGAKYIRFQVDDANDFATPLVDVSPAAAAYTFTAAQALPFGNYYWRVCSVDAAGNQSNWSATRSFLVTILKTPADQSTITDKTPLFTWAAATGATGYQIQVADTDTFDSPLIYNIYSAAVSYAPVNALPDGVLYWRMMVTTATGGSNWTTPFKFTITP